MNGFQCFYQVDPYNKCVVLAIENEKLVTSIDTGLVDDIICKNPGSGQSDLKSPNPKCHIA